MENIDNHYNLRATDITQTSLHLTWQHGDLHPPTLSRRYDIYQNNILKYSQPTGTTFLDISGLTPGTEYSYQVKNVEVSTGKVMSQSNILTVTTESNHDVYYNLRAYDITQTSLTLAWLQGNLYQQPQTVGATYDIYENNTLRHSEPTNTTFLDITGLKPGTKYSYQVKYVNVSTGKVMSQSDILTVTTEK